MTAILMRPVFTAESVHVYACTQTQHTLLEHQADWPQTTNASSALLTLIVQILKSEVAQMPNGKYFRTIKIDKIL